MPSSKIYVLVHDGTRFFGCPSTSGLTVPNHSMWNPLKPRPKTHWARALLRYVTYELFDFGSEYERAVSGVFGLPKSSLFAVFTVPPDFLDRVVETCRTIRLWHRHNTPYDHPHAWKAIALDAPKELLDLSTHFALEAYRSRKARSLTGPASGPAVDLAPESTDETVAAPQTNDRTEHLDDCPPVWSVHSVVSGHGLHPAAPGPD